METTNRLKRAAAKDTDAPGWGGYESMTEKDEKDVAVDLAEARRELIESRKRFRRMYVDTGWGHEEVERDDGAGDIADAYLFYDEMVAERKAQGLLMNLTRSAPRFAATGPLGPRAEQARSGEM